jgi:hypothetical protein
MKGKHNTYITTQHTVIDESIDETPPKEQYKLKKDQRTLDDSHVLLSLQ